MVNRTKELQDKINGTDTAIDLNGENWPVSRLIISPVTSGKTIYNGTISRSGPDGKPQYGLIELVQNKKYLDSNNINKSVIYPQGKVNVNFDNVTLDGGFDFDSGLQEHNELVAAQQGKDFNLVTNITNKAGDVTFSSCTFKNSGNSGWAGTADVIIVSNCYASRVSKHVVGCRGTTGGMRVSIDGLTTDSCGNTFDLSILDKDLLNFYLPDTAILRNISSFNNRGRTKQASKNWFVSMTNFKSEQSSVVNMNLYPALDLTFRTHHFEIDGFISINFPAYGFGTLSDTRQDGMLELRNAEIVNSLSGIKCQQRMLASKVNMTGCYQKYMSGTPAEQEVQLLSPGSAQMWADIFMNIESLYTEFNTKYNTAYVPLYWVPAAVRNLMVV